VTDLHNQLKVDKGFFAKLFGTSEEDRERDREQERGTATKRGTAATSGNREQSSPKAVGDVPTAFLLALILGEPRRLLRSGGRRPEDPGHGARQRGLRRSGPHCAPGPIPHY
jgi:hypothetical protein